MELVEVLPEAESFPGADAEMESEPEAESEMESELEMENRVSPDSDSVASQRSSRIAKRSRSASEAEDSFYTVVTPDSIANNAKKTRIDKSPVAESDGEVFAISSDSDLESTLPWKEYGGSPLSRSLFLPDLDDSDVISTSKSGSSTKPITRSVGTPNSPAVPAEVVDDDPNCRFSSPPPYPESKTPWKK
ncbi:hypothetical protein JB92DRAFT_3126649 [Gautieria morchelliformis]|nr:hypothetical protein JB92DRAFT_3126649 [Gautieria morchelliformis]